MARILYLDETGITNDEVADPYLVVAGVMVHGDSQWRGVRDAIQKVATDWLPPMESQGFIFHAKDLYHGSGYWDRDVWPSEIRNQILCELAKITVTFHIPVFAQYTEKQKFGVGILPPEQLRYPGKAIAMQGFCAMDCVVWADRWLEMFAPKENATVTAEDKHDVRNLVRSMHVILKDQNLMNRHGLGEIDGLPLKRIIDGVSFQQKNEAVALQLADLTAFILKRGLSGRHLPPDIFNTVWSQVLAGRGPKHVAKFMELSTARQASASEKPS